MELLESKLVDYFTFCAMRHEVYLNRKAGYPWPWTTDPILQKYKFTNIYRELDTGTIWLRENVREPYTEHPELFFNLALYRRYNLAHFAALLLDKFGFIEDYPYIKKDLLKFCHDYHSTSGKIFTSAHMINCARGYKSKIDYVFDYGATKLWEARREFDTCTTLEDTFNRITKLDGIGPFIGYEIVTDMRHTRYLDNAPDIMTWANPGPGAQRGILRLMDWHINNQAGLPKRPKGVGKPEFIEAMKVVLEASKEYLPDWIPTFELRDVEHALCEYDKYMRVKLGEGRPRQNYVYNG